MSSTRERILDAARQLLEKVCTAVINVVVGVAAISLLSGSLLSGAGRSAVRPPRPDYVPGRRR